MDTVQKPIDSEYYTPSSKLFTFYTFRVGERIILALLWLLSRMSQYDASSGWWMLLNSISSFLFSYSYFKKLEVYGNYFIEYGALDGKE
jgi:hypothetical protein